MNLSKIVVAILLMVVTLSVHCKTIVVDLAQSGDSTVYLPDHYETVKVKLVNVPPNFMSNYNIQTNYERIYIDAFSADNLDSQLKKGLAAKAGSKKCFAAIAKAKGQVLAFNTPKDVANQLGGIISGLYSDPNCSQVQYSLIELLRDMTTYTSQDIQLMGGYSLTIEVLEGGTVHAKRLIKRPKDDVKWLTHVGFSFVKNQGQTWYSKASVVNAGEANETTVYNVAPQNSDPSVVYTPSILFTYPAWRFETFSWGPTAGISANSDSVAALVGWSVIVKENFVLSLGVAFQEFDELNGTYYDGMPLQDGPIDSTSLTTRSFDLSYAISLGFRFGDN